MVKRQPRRTCWPKEESTHSRRLLAVRNVSQAASIAGSDSPAAPAPRFLGWRRRARRPEIQREQPPALVAPRVQPEQLGLDRREEALGLVPVAFGGNAREPVYADQIFARAGDVHRRVGMEQHAISRFQEECRPVAVRPGRIAEQGWLDVYIQRCGGRSAQQDRWAVAGTRHVEPIVARPEDGERH